MRFDPQERIRIKNRIMGILIRDVRQKVGMSKEAVANALKVSVEEYTDLEHGLEAPTLPQLEVLSYIFEVPIDHFWGGELLDREDHTSIASVDDMMLLRQRIIGVRLRQLREASNATLEQIAEKTGHRVEQLEAVERGQAALPVHELEMVANELRVSLKQLVDRHGEVGSWIQSREDFDAFAELPPELREFILKPINRSYLDLAQRFSQMNVDRLRGIAESILEITY
jgi:transcriptional regulator with XRE-family HTH domain